MPVEVDVTMIQRLVKIAVAIGGLAQLAACGLAQQQHIDRLLLGSDLSPFGPPPPPDFQELSRVLILARLRDPDSAKVKSMDFCVKEVTPVMFASEGRPMWSTLAVVNAKNAYGGYTGDQIWKIYWEKGLPVSVGNCGGGCSPPKQFQIVTCPPASTAPASTAPASTAPASTAPASTAPASAAPASAAPASTAPAIRPLLDSDLASGPVVGDATVKILYAPNCADYQWLVSSKRERAVLINSVSAAIADGYSWARDCTPPGR